MKVLLTLLLGLTGVLFGDDAEVFGKSSESSYAGKVVRIEVGKKHLSIGQSFKFWERTLERAKEEGAKAIIFDLDTPGGLAFPTKELMSQIVAAGVPTIAFVNPEAMSAGAFISFSTDKIYMRPGAQIGSAAIVNGTGQKIEKHMRAKLESFFDAHVRWVAEQKGHRKEVIQAMMVLSDKERKVGHLVVEPGKLLALNSSDAIRQLDDGPLLAVGEVNNIEEILAKEGFSKDDLVDAVPTGFERIAWWVASVSGLLIMIGLGGGYLELKTPGFGVGGIVSFAAFTLFFFGNYLAGNMAGYELAAIFVLGLVLISVEIFIIPGFGLPGITGLLMVVGSLVFSMVDGVTWRAFQWSGGGASKFFDAIEKPALHLGLGIFGSILLLYFMMRYLPNLPFMKKLMLPGALASGTGISTVEEMSERIGMTGDALTDLRPSGKAEISDEILDVVAEGEFVLKGEPVRVIKEDGMGIVVKKVPS